MKFTHLHVHSHYSLLDGLPKIDDLLDHAKKLGMDSLALTDHGVLYGAVEFYKKAKERGIKPIIGSEVYIAYEGLEQKRPNIDNVRYHLVLLVKNQEGYKNLVKIITKAHLEGFYYKPRIDEEFLSYHSEGLIALSACLQGKVPALIGLRKYDAAEKAALKYQEIFGKDNFYLEIQHHPKIKEQQQVNEGVISIAKKYGIPLVATNDSHYLRKDDSEAQDILMLINTGADPNDPERLTMKNEDFSLKSPEEMTEAFKDIPEAIENTQKIADLCQFNFELKKTKLPPFETPSGKTPDEYLKELAELGMKKRFNENITDEIKNRLNFELEAIKNLGFATYFLIVQDFVNWAKENRIVVGPGRGSAAGSLVAYCLRITNVDPLKHNLLFERFLNPGRASGLPDIDLDFTDLRRDEVINYVAEKYGRDRVAQIITFGTMAARAVIRDVGRALGYTYAFCDQLAKMIPFGFTLDDTIKQVDEFKGLYETDSQAKKLIDLAKKLEGVARHASTHACGVVISDLPLSNYVPLQHPTQDDQAIVTQYEMHAIEDMGLLKMDFLGLKNLTIIEETLKRIYAIHNKLNIDIENIPLDDPVVYKLFQEGNTVGLFQVESDGMRRYLKELKPTTFEDIIAMIALYRPGPMDLIPSFIDRKHGKEKITYIHPKLKPILENTQGICIYQEQLMKIAQELAGFTLSEADILRKAVGKKIKELLLEQEEKLVSGMVKNGIDERTARKIWTWILPFARYGFNKSHSTAYAVISYQTGWLKVHYPLEFMASLLTSERNDNERIAFLIGETEKMKIKVLAPDINESFAFFSVVPDKNQIRFGLLAIKNVGEGVVQEIIAERKERGPFLSIQDFISRVVSKNINKKSMESLTKAGVFDQFAERNQLLMNLERILEIARENQKSKNSAQKSLFGGSNGNGNQNHNNNFKLVDFEPAKNSEKLMWEKELLGLYVSSHPLKDYKKVFEKKAFPLANIPVLAVNKRIRIAGIISTIKKIITKTGRPMLFIKVEDLTDKAEVVVFPNVLEKNPAAFQENKVVFISGRISNRNGANSIIADEIEEVIEES